MLVADKFEGARRVCVRAAFAVTDYVMWEEASSYSQTNGDTVVINLF